MHALALGPAAHHALGNKADIGFRRELKQFTNVTVRVADSGASAGVARPGSADLVLR